MLSHQLFLLSTAVKIGYTLVINKAFNESLEKKNSVVYNATCDKYGNIVRVKHTHRVNIYIYIKSKYCT